MLRNNLLLALTLILLSTTELYSEDRKTFRENQSQFASGSIESSKQIDELIAGIDKNLSTYRMVSKVIFGQSAEGGSLVGYYDNSFLVKISTAFFGEAGNVVTEYYLQDDKLYFVLEKEQLYERPVSEGVPEVINENYNKYYVAGNKIIKWIDDKQDLVKNDGKNHSIKIEDFLNDITEYRLLLKDKYEQ